MNQKCRCYKPSFITNIIMDSHKANLHQVLHDQKKECQEPLKKNQMQQVDKTKNLIQRVNLNRIKKRQSLISVIIAGKSSKTDLNWEGIHLKSILESLLNTLTSPDFKIKTISINSEDNTFKRFQNHQKTINSFQTTIQNHHQIQINKNKSKNRYINKISQKAKIYVGKRK